MNEEEWNQQSCTLHNGFITYLQQKQAAGIINITAPGSTQVFKFELKKLHYCLPHLKFYILVEFSLFLDECILFESTLFVSGRSVYINRYNITLYT